MMVEIWFRDGFETERVQGDLLQLANELNVSRANGKQYAILTDINGENLMVETNNIIKAREIEDSRDALIG